MGGHRRWSSSRRRGARGQLRFDSAQLRGDGCQIAPGEQHIAHRGRTRCAVLGGACGEQRVGQAILAEVPYSRGPRDRASVGIELTV